MKSIPRLKEVVGIKSLAVALSWSLTGSLLPESFSQGNANEIIIFFVFIFTKIFVGTILCDVQDIKGDLASGIETIPTKLSKLKTKKLLLIVNSFGLPLILYCIATGLFVQLIPALLFGVLYGYIAILYYFKQRCKRLIAGLMLDGEWLPIVIIALFLLK
jgi:4-hydroxybenzoate polyprenyltransferase